MRVLLVDDNAGVLQGLRRLLRSRRGAWELSLAADGGEAMALLGDAPFDVVLSDVRMSPVNGVDLLAHVRERHPGTIRMLLSGRVDSEEAAQRGPEVAHRFLSKPCGATELLDALDRAERIRTHRVPDLARLVAEVTALPSVPQLRALLEERLADREATASEVAALVERDVAMSAKVLHLACSSFRGLGRPGASVAEAVAHLGTDCFRDLLASADVFDCPAPQARDGFSVEALSRDGRASADAAAAAGQPEEAVTASLLREVGQLVLATHRADRFAANLEEAARTGDPLSEVERRNDGCTHIDVGAHLLDLWGLPPDVVQHVRDDRPSFEHPPAAPTTLERAS